MTKILDYIKKPLVVAILSYLLGLFIGLVVLGWGIWPVQWINAEPVSLRPDLQADYLRMTIDSYIRNGSGILPQAENDSLARQRYLALGENGPAILEKVMLGYPDQNAIKNFTAVVQPAKPTVTLIPSTGETLAKTSQMTVFLVIGGAIILFGLLGFAAYKYLIPNLMHKISTGSTKRSQASNQQADISGYSASGTDQPISQFMTTYVLGDDLFDDSFSIDSPSGEFLGECGIGISETVGVGDPKKVTAFEVWLFDKNDIQTVTKVLMSAHAFNDVATFQRLQAKGEPYLVEKSKQVVLETAALQLVATATDLEYGQGALPEESYFERLTLEIAVWPKVVSPSN